MTRATLNRVVVLLLVGVLAACRVQGRARPHQVIGPEAASLRSSFNADLGKVRVLMLVAPT